MKSRNGQSNLALRPAASRKSIPSSSTHTVKIPSNNKAPRSSALPSVISLEDEAEAICNFKPFEFLKLPSELRHKIYEYHFQRAPKLIDLDPDNYKCISPKFSLFLVSKQIHEESSHYFYSTRIVRLFPIHFTWFYTNNLFARLPRRYRESVTSFQLRLGPGFTKPPENWVVNEALGLKDAAGARLLHVYAERDTSTPYLKRFRRAEDASFENFSKNLQNQILSSLPSIVEVRFDGYKCVSKNGEMMRGLIDNATEHKKLISWGPDRRWGDEE